MMTIVRRLVGRALRRFISVRSEVALFIQANDLGRLMRRELQNTALQESMEYLKANMSEATWFTDPSAMFDHVFKQLGEGVIAEFGVFEGTSINDMASRTSRTVHGFDSFEGLPHLWRGYQAMDFNLHGRLPKVRNNVRLHPGWFDRTLPKFVEDHRGERLAFLHIDCDLYSSTKTIFEWCHPMIGPGTFIQFDEFFGYPNWKNHEFKAFQEYQASRGLKVDYVGVAGRQVLVKIL